MLPSCARHVAREPIIFRHCLPSEAGDAQKQCHTQDTTFLAASERLHNAECVGIVETVLNVIGKARAQLVDGLKASQLGAGMDAGSDALQLPPSLPLLPIINQVLLPTAFLRVQVSSKALKR